MLDMILMKLMLISTCSTSSARAVKTRSSVSFKNSVRHLASIWKASFTQRVTAKYLWLIRLMTDLIVKFLRKNPWNKLKLCQTLSSMRGNRYHWSIIIRWRKRGVRGKRQTQTQIKSKHLRGTFSQGTWRTIRIWWNSTATKLSCLKMRVLRQIHATRVWTLLK